jgi:hypothetical protein
MTQQMALRTYKTSSEGQQDSRQPKWLSPIHLRDDLLDAPYNRGAKRCENSQTECLRESIVRTQDIHRHHEPLQRPLIAEADSKLLDKTL